MVDPTVSPVTPAVTAVPPAPEADPVLTVDEAQEQIRAHGRSLRDRIDAAVTATEVEVRGSKKALKKGDVKKSFMGRLKGLGE